MTTERTRLLAEKARIEAEHPDKCFTDGVRQLAEIIREQRTANWLSVAAVLDHCAENIDRLHAAAPLIAALEEALPDLLSLLEFAESAEAQELVGDEGCLWVVENGRAALTRITETLAKHKGAEDEQG